MSNLLGTMEEKRCEDQTSFASATKTLRDAWARGAGRSEMTSYWTPRKWLFNLMFELSDDRSRFILVYSDGEVVRAKRLDRPQLSLSLGETARRSRREEKHGEDGQAGDEDGLWGRKAISWSTSIDWNPFLGWGGVDGLLRWPGMMSLISQDELSVHTVCTKSPVHF